LVVQVVNLYFYSSPSLFLPKVGGANLRCK
jgi:hypothetical protein